MRKVIIAVIAVVSLSSCAGMIGTPSGIREYGRYQNGLLSGAKAKPDSVDAYHKTQNKQEEQKTTRKLGYFEQLAEAFEEAS